MTVAVPALAALAALVVSAERSTPASAVAPMADATFAVAVGPAAPVLPAPLVKTHMVTPMVTPVETPMVTPVEMLVATTVVTLVATLLEMLVAPAAPAVGPTSSDAMV